MSVCASVLAFVQWVGVAAGGLERPLPKLGCGVQGCSTAHAAEVDITRVVADCCVLCLSSVCVPPPPPPHTHTYHTPPRLLAACYQVGKLLGEEWKALSAEDKVQYEAQAAKDKERYAAGEPLLLLALGGTHTLRAFSGGYMWILLAWGTCPLLQHCFSGSDFAVVQLSCLSGASDAYSFNTCAHPQITLFFACELSFAVWQRWRTTRPAGQQQQRPQRQTVRRTALVGTRRRRRQQSERDNREGCAGSLHAAVLHGGY